MVGTGSGQYRIARRYMGRLSREDLEDPETLGAMARVAGMSPEQFRERFGHAVDAEAARRILAEAFAA